MPVSCFLFPDLLFECEEAGYMFLRNIISLTGLNVVLHKKIELFQNMFVYTSDVMIFTFILCVETVCWNG
jgi:hypothetical protein